MVYLSAPGVALAAAKEAEAAPVLADLPETLIDIQSKCQRN